MEDLIFKISVQGLDEQTRAIGELDSEVSQLNQTIKAQREEAKKLEAANSQSTVAYQELQQAIGANIVQAKELNKQKADLIRQTQNEATANQKSEGSIDALRAKLSTLTKEYNALGKQQRETGEGKAIQQQARAISDELKNLESAIGDNRRNVGNYKGALAQVEASMLELITTQVALTKANKVNSDAFKANEAALKALQDEYQGLQSEQAEVTAQFNNLTQAENEAGESTESLKAKLRGLKEAAAIAGEGTEDFKRLTAEAAALQDKIDDANEAIKAEKGTAFERFREQLGGVGQSLGNLDFKQANERISQLGSTLKNLTFSSLKEGIKGATSSFAAFGKVLLSNPIFLIVAIIAAVGIALFSLKDKIAIVGKAFDLITAPIRFAIQLMKDLGDAIGVTSFEADKASAKTVENILSEEELRKKSISNKLKDLDREIAIAKAQGKNIDELTRKRLEAGIQELKFEEAKLKARNKVLQLIRALTKEEINEVDNAINELKDAQTELLVFEGQLEKERKSKESAAEDDANKKNAKRIENLAAVNNQLQQLRNQNTLASIKDVTERTLFELETQNKANLKSVDKLKETEEIKQQLRDEYNKSYKLSVEKVNEELKNAQIKSNEDLLANLEKLQTELIGSQEEKELEILRIAFEARQKELQAAIDLLNKKEQLNAEEVKQKQLLSDTLEAEELIYQNKRLKIITDAKEKENLAQKELAVLTAQNLKEQREAELALFDEKQKQELAKLEKGSAEYNLAVEKARQEREDINAKFDDLEDQRLAKAIARRQSELAQVSGIVTEFGNLANAVTEAQLADLDKRYANQLKNVEKGSEEEKKILEKKTAEENKIKKQQFDNNKALQIAQTSIQIASNAVAAYGALVGLGPAGPILAAAAAAAAIATGFAQLAAIKKQEFKPTKLARGGKLPFDTGGVIEGASHAQGGVPFVAGGQLMEAEGGELIVNKNIWSRPDFVDSISAMNAATGGVRFADGGVVSPRFTPSGQSITSAAISQTQNDFSALVPILSNIQVTNNVVDTTSNQATLINITNNSTIG